MNCVSRGDAKQKLGSCSERAQLGWLCPPALVFWIAVLGVEYRVLMYVQSYHTSVCDLGPRGWRLGDYHVRIVRDRAVEPPVKDS